MWKTSGMIRAAGDRRRGRCTACPSGPLGRNCTNPGRRGRSRRCRSRSGRGTRRPGGSNSTTAAQGDTSPVPSRSPGPCACGRGSRAGRPPMPRRRWDRVPEADDARHEQARVLDPLPDVLERPAVRLVFAELALPGFDGVVAGFGRDVDLLLEQDGRMVAVSRQIGHGLRPPPEGRPFRLRPGSVLSRSDGRAGGDAGQSASTSRRSILSFMAGLLGVPRRCNALVTSRRGLC